MHIRTMHAQRLRWLLALVLVGIGWQPAMAQSGVWEGPETRVSSLGLSHLEGKVSREKPGPDDQYRDVEYVVSQLHGEWPGEKTDDAWARYRTLATTRWFWGIKQKAVSVELIDGYAYVVMKKAGISPVVIEPEEAVFFIIEDPNTFLPLALEELRRFVPAQDFDEFAARIRKSVETLGETQRSFMAWRDDSLDDTVVMDLIADSSIPTDRDMQQLLRDYSSVDLSPDRDAEITVQLLLKATAPDQLRSGMILIKLPFILSNQTVGGAEGTEIVVYTNPIDDDNSEVYYFYVHTHDASKKVELSAYDSTGSLLSTSYKLDLCKYVKLELKRQGDKWILKSPIVQKPINSSMPTHLQNILRAAHRDATIAGVNGGNGPDATGCNDFVFSLDALTPPE